MQKELRYFLRLPDGTFSKGVESLEEMQEAMLESGRFGIIWAGMLMPFKTSKIVFEDVEEIENTGEDPKKPEKTGTKSSLPKKARRAKRVTSADSSQRPSSVLPINGAASKE